MVDFICPECGSINHVDGESVRYPHQCPGCESIIEADGPALLEGDPEANAAHPVRVRLLPLELWTAKKPRPAPQPESRRPRRITRGSLVFPALLAPVLAITAYVWLKYPDLTDESQRLQLQVAVPAASVEAAPNPSVSTEPISTPEKKLKLAVRRNPEDETPANDESQQQKDAAAILPPEPAESRLPEPGTSAPAAQPEPPLTPRGVTTARPLYPGVPIVNEPSWQGREIVAASAMDMLLILDRRVHNQWLHVIHVGTGREGWVRVSQVRISVNGE